MQVPIFFNRQVFVKLSPGEIIVPSGIVMSSMNCPALQLEVGSTAVDGMDVFVAIKIGEDVIVAVTWDCAFWVN